MSILLFAACQKNDTSEPNPGNGGNTTDMQIALLQPENGSYLDSGAMIDFEVYIEDKLSLHEYAVRLNADSLLMDEEGHTHSYEKTVSMQWVNDRNKGDTLRLQVISTNHKAELLERDFWFVSR